MREFSQFAATPYSFKGLQGRVTSAGSASAGLLQRFGGSMQASLIISTVVVRQVPPLKSTRAMQGMLDHPTCRMDQVIANQANERLYGSWLNPQKNGMDNRFPVIQLTKHQSKF